MGKKKTGKHIQRSGNAGNSKKGSKEEVKALLEAKKAQQEARQAPAQSSSSSASTSASSSRAKREPSAYAKAEIARAAADTNAKTSSPASSSAGSTKPKYSQQDACTDTGLAIAAPLEEQHQSEEQMPIDSGVDMTQWTGKSPQTQLFELCRRNKWHKPYFKLRPRGAGVTCAVEIARDDSKEGKKTRYLFDKRVYVDAQNARNFAAVYALHAINFDKPMHRLFPGAYRDYWLQLEDKRKASKHASKPCPPDPFSIPSRQERDEQRRVEAKRRERQREMDPSKQYPIVNMEESARETVHRAVQACFDYTRRFQSGTSHDTASSGTNGEQGGTGGKKKVLSSLISRGFLREHAEEALQYTSNTADAVRWLCLHVPELDLPEAYRPVHTTITAHQHNPETLARQYKADRLAAFGFSNQACMQALLYCQDDEDWAAAFLVKALLQGKDINAALPEDDVQGLVESLGMSSIQAQGSSNNTPFEDEEDAMLSIYPNACSVRKTDTGGSVLELRDVDVHSFKGKTKLEVRVPKHHNYPDAPSIVLVSNDALPGYVRLAVIRELNQLSAEQASQSLPVAFEAVQHLQDCGERIMKERPALTSLVAKPSAEHSAAEQTLLDSMTSASLDEDGDSDSEEEEATVQRPKIPRKKLEAMSKSLQQREQQQQQTSKYLTMREKRSKLPSYKMRSDIISIIKQNQVVVISGDTGCGKTTQVPQFLLEEMLLSGNGAECQIVCTQPRRLSAIAVATRVAEERAERLGRTVGYSIRSESKRSKDTRLLFCTTGVLLRQLQNQPDLGGISHIFVDEVHERSLDSDVLLAFLRRMLPQRPDLRVVLMSATLDAKRFSEYYSGAPCLSIPGFAHPVKEVYIDGIVAMTGRKPSLPSVKEAEKLLGPFDEQEWRSQTQDPEQARELFQMAAVSDIDYNVVRELVAHIHRTDSENGAILIFMPGMAEIVRTMSALRQLGDELWVLPLHSSLAQSQQSQVFKSPPAGCRKVVVSTNIAETSITIDDVTHVIDSGKMKENRFDSSRGVSLLSTVWVSRAAATQRRGRAGRTRPGTCYRLFSLQRFRRMAAQQDPEILRLPLEQLYLRIKATLDADVTAVLSQFLDAPSSTSIQTAERILSDVGALSKDRHLTALGQHLSLFPADVRVGKMLLYGALMQCLDPVLTLAACASTKPLFVSPLDKRDEADQARAAFNKETSDQLAALRAFEEWRKLSGSSQRSFCDKNFLSTSALAEVLALRQQFFDILCEMGFAKSDGRVDPRQQLGDDELNFNSHDTNILRAVLCAGLYPNVLRVQQRVTYYQTSQGAFRKEGDARDCKLYSRDHGRVFLHPSSTLFHVSSFRYPFLVYQELSVGSTKTFAHSVSMVSIMSVLLLSGGEIIVNADKGLLSIDGWLKLKASPRVAALVSELKEAIDRVIAAKLRKPKLDLSKSPAAEACRLLLASDGAI